MVHLCSEHTVKFHKDTLFEVEKASDNAGGFIDLQNQNCDSIDILQVAIEISFLQVDENMEIILEDIEWENIGFPEEKN